MSRADRRVNRDREKRKAALRRLATTPGIRASARAAALRDLTAIQQLQDAERREALSGWVR